MSPTAEELEHEQPNPPRRGLRKGLYLIPSAFTAANIGMGFFSVMSSLRGFQLLGAATPDFIAAAAHFDNAAIAIGWALLFDMLDGRIARLTKTTTEIGIQLDSIADVVTFGLAPAILAYVWGYGVSPLEGSRSAPAGVVYFVPVPDVWRVSIWRVSTFRPHGRAFSPKGQ